MEELIEFPQCEDAGGYPGYCEGAVNLMNCPYAMDIYDEIVPVWLCDRHEYERAMDI